MDQPANPATVLVAADAGPDSGVEVREPVDGNSSGTGYTDSGLGDRQRPLCPPSVTWKGSAYVHGQWGRIDAFGNLAIGGPVEDVLLFSAIAPFSATLHHHLQGAPDVMTESDDGHFEIRGNESVNVMMAPWLASTAKGPTLLVSHMAPSSSYWLEWPMTDSWPAVQVDAQADGSWRIIVAEQREGGVKVRWARLHEGKLALQGTGSADLVGANVADGWNLSSYGDEVFVSGPYGGSLVKGAATEPPRPAYVMGWSVKGGGDQAKPAWVEQVLGWTGTASLLAVDQGRAIATGDQCSGGPCRLEIREVGPGKPVMAPVALGGADFAWPSAIRPDGDFGVYSGSHVNAGSLAISDTTCWRIAKDGRALWSRPIPVSNSKDPVDVDLTCRTYPFRNNSITVIVTSSGTGPATQSQVELVAADEFGNRGCAESGPCWGRSVADCADTNPCTSDLCDAAHGGCYNPPLPDGTSCGAGKFCKSATCL